MSLDDLGCLPRCSCNQYLPALEIVRHCFVVALVSISCDSTKSCLSSEVDVQRHQAPHESSPQRTLQIPAIATSRFCIFFLFRYHTTIATALRRSGLVTIDRIHRKQNLVHRIMLTRCAVVNHVTLFGSS